VYLSQADPHDRSTWSRPVEARIVERYGHAFQMDLHAVQQHLANLGFYRGEVDGDAGPLTREAVAAFQRAWGLRDDGVPGPRTQRTIAYVTAGREVVPLERVAA
jgi:murein L,D-transpeptidase YcbB/YkuD